MASGEQDVTKKYPSQGVRNSDLYKNMSDLDKEILDQRMRTRGYVSRQKQRTMGHETFDMPSYHTPDPVSVDLNYGQSVYDHIFAEYVGLSDFAANYAMSLTTPRLHWLFLIYFCSSLDCTLCMQRYNHFSHLMPVFYIFYKK